MRMQGRVLAALLVLGTAGSALAVSKGGTLYVKAKNTRLMAGSTAQANVVQVLQPGQEVRWLGADPSNTQWHQVEVSTGKKSVRGVVLQSNLSTKPPAMELIAGKGTVTQKEATKFANSAAAVKLVAEGAVRYGERKQGDIGLAVKTLEALEGIARSVTEAEYAEHARVAGLTVAGPSDKGGNPVAKEEAP
jgi:uncharacterized protein YgiM (DUF1202 family)